MRLAAVVLNFSLSLRLPTPTGPEVERSKEMISPAGLDPSLPRHLPHAQRKIPAPLGSVVSLARSRQEEGALHSLPCSAPEHLK